MIPLFYKFAAIVFAFVCIMIPVGIKLGGWADDHYGTGALILVVCTFVILAVAGLVGLLILMVPYLV